MVNFTRQQQHEINVEKLRQRTGLAQAASNLAQADSRTSKANIELPFHKTVAKAGLIQARTSQIRGGMNLIDWAKPFIIGLIIVVVIFGPGVFAVGQILNSLNLWMWGIAIILGILLWRNV